MPAAGSHTQITLIWTVLTLIGILPVSTQIGGSVRVARDEGLLRGVARSVLSGMLIAEYLRCPFRRLSSRGLLQIPVSVLAEEDGMEDLPRQESRPITVRSAEARLRPGVAG